MVTCGEMQLRISNDNPPRVRGGRGAADRSGSSEAITGPIDRGVDSFGELPRSSETLKKHIDRGFAEASTGPIDRDLGSFAECLGSSETCHETNIVIIATLFLPLY